VSTKIFVDGARNVFKMMLSKIGACLTSLAHVVHRTELISRETISTGTIFSRSVILARYALIL
jgi:hypothetical protein